MRLKNILEEINIVDDMEILSTAYEEISVMHMQRVRAKVLSSRSFVDSLQTILMHVRSAYRHQVEDILKKKKQSTEGTTFSTLPNNGKDVVVLLSANAKLYGDIIPKTFNTFTQKIANTKADICIVGLLGKELYEELSNKKQYTFFEISDKAVSPQDIKKIVSYLAQYKSVTVYYGKFENVISQIPQATLVSGQDAFATEENASGKSYKFFYEPSLEEMLNFFETQFFSSLFQQTIHEHELARHASRIKTMEQALLQIHTRKKVLARQKKRMTNSLRNAKQLQTISGISLWRKKHL